MTGKKLLSSFTHSYLYLFFFNLKLNNVLINEADLRTDQECGR